MVTMNSTIAGILNGSPVSAVLSRPSRPAPIHILGQAEMVLKAFQKFAHDCCEGMSETTVADLLKNPYLEIDKLDTLVETYMDLGEGRGVAQKTHVSQSLYEVLNKAKAVVAAYEGRHSSSARARISVYSRLEYIVATIAPRDPLYVGTWLLSAEADRLAKLVAKLPVGTFACLDSPGVGGGFRSMLVCRCERGPNGVPRGVFFSTEHNPVTGIYSRRYLIAPPDEGIPRPEAALAHIREISVAARALIQRLESGVQLLPGDPLVTNVAIRFA